MSFDSLKLNPALLKNIYSLGFKVPTVIQEQAIPIALAGKDLLGIAKTGSGKSASFIIPIINKLLADRNTERNRQPKVLILVPTRELAMQLAEVTHTLSRNLDRPIESMAVYGGVSINPQMKSLYGVKILIATPGRLLDLHRSNALSLHKVNTLVLKQR